MSVAITSLKYESPQSELTKIREKKTAHRKANTSSTDSGWKNLRGVNIAWRVKTATIGDGEEEEEENRKPVSDSA